MGDDDRLMRETAKQTAALTQRDYPPAKLRPAKVIAVDSDTSAALLYVTVILAGDSVDNPTTCTSLVGEPNVGDTVMVIWEPPQGLYVIGYLSRCVPRTQLMWFSAGYVTDIGEISAPGRVDSDCVLSRIIVDTGDIPATATLWRIMLADGTELTQVQHVGVQTTEVTLAPHLDVLYEDMPLFVECLDNGSADWVSVTFTLVARMGCTEIGTAEGGGPEE